MLDNITKKYKNKTILDAVSMKLLKQCSLIIGENGSGKTTLLKILSGLIKNYDGISNFDNNVSVLLDVQCIFLSKTGTENLKYFLNEQECNVAQKYIQKFKMQTYMNNKAKKYSNGMKKKLMLSIALSKEKDVIVLDEPTNSLDCESVAMLKKILISLKSSKKIIIASHDVAIFDVELIDTIYFIKNHKVIEKCAFEYNYEIIKVKVLQSIDNFENYYLIKKESENSYYFKIKRYDIERFAYYINKYIVVGFSIINHMDEVYIKEFYNDKDN